MAALSEEMDAADQLYRHALELIEAHDATEIPTKGIICDWLADLAYLRNNLDCAERFAEEAVSRGEAGGEVLKIAVPAWLTLARVGQARGDATGALDAIDRAACLSNWPHIRAWRARIWLMQGNLAAASAWARESGPVRPILPPSNAKSSTPPLPVCCWRKDALTRQSRCSIDSLTRRLKRAGLVGRSSS